MMWSINIFQVFILHFTYNYWEKTTERFYSTWSSDYSYCDLHYGNVVLSMATNIFKEYNVFTFRKEIEFLIVVEKQAT